ncbi:Uncharacterized protein, contains GYD domain [Dethiosulfatibacter aminovorans DSM 17477]|uniref:Uncharacterized protein, contains GYD domain n=1 Tax=Dethiosulfatibacter aminovorans DSM 17477 TaxID=1121476 RepID=A0A1M6MDC6_9FIRM|nr:GYD domain-containing protein [Dethiosulfatibacter aminovorans]SHJ81462.1 Uncharacterized protein, contains GYD domain [Dethiosulfatibacter aminovorans DSM 17477]
MAKFLFYGSYAPEGLKGVMEEGGSGRVEAAKRTLESVGGKLEAFYYALGENDFYIIVDLPDNKTAMAVTSVGNITGTFSIKAITLLTPEEVDDAAKLDIPFRKPSGNPR